MKRRALGLFLLFGAFDGCTCVDLSQGLAYRCTYNATDNSVNISQCSTGWRCGLNDSCHQIGVPKTYACANDNDCEDGWRCAPNTQCVDPFADALRPNADSGTPVVSKISPLLGAPSKIAVSEEFFVGDPCRDFSPMTTVSVISDGGLTKLAYYPQGRLVALDGGPNPICEDPNPPAVWTDVVSTTAPPNPLEIAEIATNNSAFGRTLSISPGDEVCTYDFTPPSTFTSSCASGLFGFSPSQLRVNNDGNSSLIAFNTTQYEYYDPFNGVQGGIGSGPGSILYDMDYLENTFYPQGTLLAAADTGLYVNTFGSTLNPINNEAGTGWINAGIIEGYLSFAAAGDGCTAANDGPGRGSPVKLKNSVVDGGMIWNAGNQTFDLTGQHLLAVEFRGNPVGDEFLVAPTLFDYSAGTTNCPNVPSGYLDFYGYPLWFNYFPDSLTDTVACSGDGSPLITDFNFAPNPPDATAAYPWAAEIHWQGPPSVDTMALTYGAGCQSTAPTTSLSTAKFTRPKVFQNSNHNEYMEADDLGHLWLSRDRTLETMALTLDRPPVGVFGAFGAGLFAATGPEVVTQVSVPYEISPPQLFQWLPKIGLSTLQTHRDDFTFGTLALTATPALGPIQTVASVDLPGKSWAVLLGENNSAEFQIGVAEVNTGNPILFRLLAARSWDVSWPGPYRSAGLTNQDGQTVILVAANNLLLYADLTDVANNPDAGADLRTPNANFLVPQLNIATAIPGATSFDSMYAVSASPDAGTADGGLYAETFLLANGDLFHVKALTSYTWEPEQIFLPPSDGLTGQPIKAYKVFHDGARGRVAFNDGAIYSVPSLVQIAPPLPAPDAGVQPAQDALQLCQNVFQLGADGLYSLQANDTSPIGTWIPVPITGSLLPSGASNWTGGKLYAAGSDILVFHPLGLVYRVTGYTCSD